MDIELPDEMDLSDIAAFIHAIGKAGTAKAMTMGAMINRLPADPQRDQLLAEAKREAIDNVANTNRLFQVVIAFVEQGQLLEAAKLLSEMIEEVAAMTMSIGMLGMQAAGFTDEITDELADRLDQVNDSVQAALDRAGLGK